MDGPRGGINFKWSMKKLSAVGRRRQTMSISLVTRMANISIFNPRKSCGKITTLSNMGLM